MRLVVSLALAVLLSGLSTAHAGGYVTLGIGSDVGESADRGSGFEPGQLSAGRLGAGFRVGPLALEASLLGTGLRDTATAVAEPALSAAVDLKYYMGLAGPLEGYLRGGMAKAWMHDQDGVQMNYAGRGYQVGGGLQFTFAPLPLGEVALWLDYTHQMLEMSGEDGSESLAREASATAMTMGLAVGF